MNETDSSDDSRHENLHEIFQRLQSEPIADPRIGSYRFSAAFEYSVAFDGTDFTEEELANIRSAIDSWNQPNIRFCEINRSEDGFIAIISSDLPNGTSLGRDLFLFLARDILRSLDKSVSYVQI